MKRTLLLCGTSAVVGFCCGNGVEPVATAGKCLVRAGDSPTAPRRGQAYGQPPQFGGTTRPTEPSPVLPGPGLQSPGNFTGDSGPDRRFPFAASGRRDSSLDELTPEEPREHRRLRERQPECRQHHDPERSRRSVLLDGDSLRGRGKWRRDRSGRAYPDKLSRDRGRPRHSGHLLRASRTTRSWSARTRPTTSPC